MPAGDRGPRLGRSAYRRTLHRHRVSADSIDMVHLSPSSLLERARTPGGRKLVRYSLVSVISVVVSQIVLFLAQFAWSARTSNIVAVCLSAVPSYQLNRAWAWGKTGRSHLMKEIVPFWGMCLLGLILSTWSVDYAESHAASITSSHAGPEADRQRRRPGRLRRAVDRQVRHPQPGAVRPPRPPAPRRPNPSRELPRSR